jgi:hypothetical protein
MIGLQRPDVLFEKAAIERNRLSWATLMRKGPVGGWPTRISPKRGNAINLGCSSAPPTPFAHESGKSSGAPVYH